MASSTAASSSSSSASSAYALVRGAIREHPVATVGGNQGTLSTANKGLVATWCSATLKRIKWYEIILGATGNPNATDTYIRFFHPHGITGETWPG
jgi:hypothetical protein